jgi:hypothetical protein
MNPKPINADKTRLLWVWIIGGCIAFGCLMALRSTLDSIWARAVLAATAAGILAFSFLKGCKSGK